MKSLIKLVNQIILEQSRYRFESELYNKLHSLSDKLWKDRKKKYTKKTLIDVLPFKFPDGVDGLVKIIINPRLSYIGQMGPRPWKSLDPADLYIEVNPKHYKSKRNLYLTLYHEMIHALDPKLSYLWTPSYEFDYDPRRDETYWGHPIEFSPISNEFLEGLVLEFKRRRERIKNLDNISLLKKSLDNIVNFFENKEPLNKLSLDILYRINDQYVNPNKISRLISDFSTTYPEVADFIPPKEEEPSYISILSLVSKFNPEIFKEFLMMLKDTKTEIEEFLK